MAVQFTILGSGSGGNCAYLEVDDTRILIDAGFSGRQIRQRLAQIGRTPESLHGILITHEHSDHIQGVLALCGKLGIPIYCNRLTREAIELQFEERFDCRIFVTGSGFEVGSIAVDTFSVPHDAYDPVGFLFHPAGVKIGFITHSGPPTKFVGERVREANILLLEANHDLKMLKDDPKRPWSLKQRILSRHGHLSNEAAADVIQEIVTAELRHLYLGHLSRDCNTPELAHRTICERLKKVGATHVKVESTSQETPCASMELIPHIPEPATSIPEIISSPESTRNVEFTGYLPLFEPQARI